MNKLGRTHFLIVIAIVIVFLPLVIMTVPTAARVESLPSPTEYALALPAHTPTAAPTATRIEPTATVQTEPEMESTDPGPGVNRGLVRVSHYNPKLGGVNCARFVNGECVSKMASGEPWQDWIDVAIACPPEWPFGTRVTLIETGDVWICKDRGSKVQFVDGIPWIDQLRETTDIPYGTIMLADVQLPGR